MRDRSEDAMRSGPHAFPLPPAEERRTAKGLLKMGAKNSDLIFDCKDFWRIITCNWMHVGWVLIRTTALCMQRCTPRKLAYSAQAA